MANNLATIQVCVTCKRADDQDVVEGKALYDALCSAREASATASKCVSVEPVKCMNGCSSACTAAIRADGKYNFVIGALDASDERVADLLGFAQSVAEAEDGLPAWRARPVHIRKNTLARLHPIAPLTGTKE